VTTNTGSIDLLYFGDEVDGINQPCKPVGSFTPPLGDTMERRAVNAYPTCASIIKVSRSIIATRVDDYSTLPPDARPAFVVICGASDGKIYLQQLRTSLTDMNNRQQLDGADTVLDIRQPFVNTSRPIQPYHFDRVKTFTNMGSDGLILTGALDGTIRLWNIESSRMLNDTDSGSISMTLIYQLMGYKVWLGSIWTDGTRIISDGADNAIIVHDFSMALRSTTPLSTRLSNRFDDIDENPFDSDDGKKQAPSSPRSDGDSPSPDESPMI
jgi:WD40 repeat protein